MAAQALQQQENLFTLFTAATVDLPLAMTRQAWGIGGEKDVTEAVWKGYDAWVRWTTASVTGLYRSPLFGEMTAGMLDRWLRWQRLSNAAAGAFFAGLWPTVGLPTAAAVQALREEVDSLQTHLNAQEEMTQTMVAELRVLRSGLLPQSVEYHNGTAKKAEPLEVVPAHRNGHVSVSDGAPLLSQPPSTQGHNTKERRKGYGIAA